MRNSGWLSVLGLYHYDQTIFDQLELPTAAELDPDLPIIDQIVALDKDTLIAKLCLDLGELGLVYTEPDTLRGAIGVWSRVQHYNWLQLWQTMLYKYNPIWNKDGSYTETRDLSGTGTRSGQEQASGSREGTETRSGTSSETTSSQTSTSGTVNHNVTGFDTNSYSPDTQDASNGSTTGSGSRSGQTGDSITTGEETSSSGTSSEQTGKTEKETIVRKEQGNIGVTTTQAMIAEQRNIVEFNLYNYIVQDFKRMFCIQIY